MPTVREPALHPVATGHLRPTQVTVGMRACGAIGPGWSQLASGTGAGTALAA